MKRGTLTKDNDVRCECRGQVAVEGTMTQQLPIGLGFVNGRFQVDAVRRSGFYGFCLECGEQVFAPKGKFKSVTARAKTNSTRDIRRSFRELKIRNV